MALTDEGTGFNVSMPVAPAYMGGGYGNNGGFGGFGGDWGWIILLLLCCGGGWGGFGGFGGMGGFGGAMWDFPWLINGQNGINANTNAQFAQAATQSAIGDLASAVNTGFGNIATQLCGGFAGVNAGIANGFAQAEIAENSRQLANMNQMYGIQSQLAQCCCDNRLATAQTQALVQSENCADRYEAAQNTSAIIQAITGGIQAIKDDLCQDRLDAERRENANLRSELMFARGQASQDVQTATIQAGQRALANEVEQYVLPTPRPAYIVQNPNCCYNPCGTNCGCGVG